MKISLRKIFVVPLLAVTCAALSAASPISIPAVTNIAAMKALGAASAFYPTVYVKDYGAAGSGGGGVFVWNASSTTATNVCTVFQATAVSTGRWIRQVGNELSIDQCGAVLDGTTDDQAALQAALSAGPSVVSLPPGSRTAKIGSGVTYDVSKVEVDCKGQTLDFSTIGSTTAITLTTSITDPNTMGGYNTIHPLHDCFLIGPSEAGGNTAKGVVFTPSTISGAPWITGMAIERIGVTGFHKVFNFGGGIVGIAFNDIWAGSNAAGTRLTGTVFNFVGGANSGENWHINHVFMSNLTACFNDEGSTGDNVDIYATAVSCDGANYVLTGGNVAGTAQSRMTVFYSGHIEALGGASNYVIDVANGGFVFRGGSWVNNTALNHTACRTTGTTGSVGIRFEDVQFDGTGVTATPFSYYFCDGSGPMWVSGAAALGNTAVGLLSQGNNTIQDYTFSADPTATWTTSGTVGYDTAVKPSGAVGSFTLSANAGTSQAFITTACKPQQIGAIMVQVQTTGIVSSSGHWNVVLSYTNFLGQTISSFSYSGGNVTTDNATFANAQVTPNAPAQAPPGTANCRMLVSVTSGSGAAKLWFGLPLLVAQ